MIDEGNDPEILKNYMDKSDGPYFINCLELTADKEVLEIGVGTGRLAVRVAGRCGKFTGIDISEKTVKKARENLKGISNVSIILGDFLDYDFQTAFDVIYSSQVFWHIADKKTAIKKIAGLLKTDGQFVLSIEKEQAEILDYGSRKVLMFPDDKDAIMGFIKDAGLCIMHVEELERAYVIISKKLHS